MREAWTGRTFPWLRLPGWVVLACSSVGAQTGTPLLRAVAPPAGQTLPVSLEHGVRAGRSQPGAAVVGYVTQRVPVSAQTYLPRGAEVLGTVVRSTAASGAQPAEITLRFDRLRWHGSTVPLPASAVALADVSEVRRSELPINGIADRDVPGPANWTTEQVGGDQLMRSGWVGELDGKGMRKVGFADFHGVYGDPASLAGGHSLPRALGAFSADAQGLYGFDEAAVLRTGAGEFTVTAPGKLQLHGDDQILLLVTAP